MREPLSPPTATKTPEDKVPARKGAGEGCGGPHGVCGGDSGSWGLGGRVEGEAEGRWPKLRPRPTPPPASLPRLPRKLALSSAGLGCGLGAAGEAGRKSAGSAGEPTAPWLAGPRSPDPCSGEVWSHPHA